MTEKLISIIVPVYNIGQYLTICLESILAQTYENLEIIIVDDGSTDGSGDICDEYAKKDARIKVLHQPNRGLSFVRNIGLTHAKGEYIGFVDSDDKISADMYQTMYDLLTDCDADIVSCGQYMVIENNVYAHQKITAKVELLTTKEALSKLLLNDVTTSACDKLYKREIFNQPIFLEGVFYEDLRAMADILLRCKRVALMHTPHYYYTTRRNGSICNSFSAKHMKDMFGACVFRNKRIKEHYPDLTKVADVSQMYHDTVICNRIVHKMRRDPELSALGEQIRKDVKQYPASYVWSLPVLLIPSFIILRYLPLLFGFYVYVEQSVRWLTDKCKKMAKYMLR